MTSCLGLQPSVAPLHIEGSFSWHVGHLHAVQEPVFSFKRIGKATGKRSHLVWQGLLCFPLRTLVAHSSSTTVVVVMVVLIVVVFWP